MLNFRVPINNLSFGNFSYNILKELYNRKEDVCIFPYGGKVDLTSYTISTDFATWLKETLETSLERFDSNSPSLELWHINGCFESIGKHQNLITFHETDRLTKAEINLLRQKENVFVTSNYTKNIFEQNGVHNVKYFKPCADYDTYKRLDRNFNLDDRISFGLRGKLEKRKHTVKVLKSWVKRFGGNFKYRLDCSIFNPFIPAKDQSMFILSELGGKIPGNVNILPFQEKNDIFNIALNAVDIDLTGMSGCEGFNFPLFQSLVIGKQAVVLNAHAHKDYCNKNNSFLVQPKKEMIQANDGIFFKSGEKFNQGNWFDFDENEFIEMCEKASLSAKERNVEGEKLKEEFSAKNMVDTLLSYVR